MTKPILRSGGFTRYNRQSVLKVRRNCIRWRTSFVPLYMSIIPHWEAEYKHYDSIVTKPESTGGA
jgi:hypothetical protein